MSHELLAGIAAGIVLRDFLCWSAAKVCCRWRQKRADQQRAAARQAAEAERIAQAKADLAEYPFTVETCNDHEFILTIRKVYCSLRAIDSSRFFNVYNGEVN